MAFAAYAPGSQTAAKASWQAKAKVFTVVISLDKTLTEIKKPGMSAQVTINVGNSDSQLLAPRNAVRFNNPGATVTRIESPEQKRHVAVTMLAADGKHYADVPVGK